MSRVIGVTVGTSISPEALKKKLNIDSASGGNSFFYMDNEVEYPVGNGFYTYTVAKISLSNGGSGIRVGDIIIASNGTLCKVTSVGTMVGYKPFGTISENSNDSGGNVDQSGLSATASALLITILRNGVYTSDQSANITALAAALSVTEPEVPDIPDEPDIPDVPEADITQNGSVLTIVSGVTATQSGSVLSIR